MVSAAAIVKCRCLWTTDIEIKKKGGLDYSALLPGFLCEETHKELLQRHHLRPNWFLRF